MGPTPLRSAYVVLGHYARETKSIILARYAELDPVAAVEAAMATTGSDDALVRAVFAAWGKYDHAAALEHARALPELQRRYAAVAVLGTADALGADEKQEIAESFSVLHAYARMQAQESALDDPVAAWDEAVAAHGPQPDAAGREALWRIAQRWADSDPRAAVTAVAALPFSAQRRSWLSTLVKHWARVDLAAASTWAEALPSTPERASVKRSAALSVRGPGTPPRPRPGQSGASVTTRYAQPARRPSRPPGPRRIRTGRCVGWRACLTPTRGQN